MIPYMYIIKFCFFHSPKRCHRPQPYVAAKKLRVGALALSTCVLLILCFTNKLGKMHPFIVGDSGLFIFFLDLCTYHRLFIHIIILGILDITDSGINPMMCGP